MKQDKGSDFGFFTAKQVPPVLEIRFKHHLLDHLVDFSCRDIIENYFRRVRRSGKITVILVNSDFTDAGCEAYARFIARAEKNGSQMDIHRLMNLTRQLIQAVMGLDQLVIHVSSGHVISLFLNISLACDYRIASEKTVFCNPYLDLGVVPLGGGPYFLSKKIGIGRAWEVLLCRRDISASRAFSLGLVDRVISPETLDDTAWKIANRFAETPQGTIAGLKQLMNYNRRDISDYFDLEKEAMLRRLM